MTRFTCQLHWLLHYICLYEGNRSSLNTSNEIYWYYLPWCLSSSRTFQVIFNLDPAIFETLESVQKLHYELIKHYSFKSQKYFLPTSKQHLIYKLVFPYSEIVFSIFFQNVNEVSPITTTKLFANHFPIRYIRNKFGMPSSCSPPNAFWGADFKMLTIFSIRFPPNTDTKHVFTIWCNMVISIWCLYLYILIIVIV